MEKFKGKNTAEYSARPEWTTRLIIEKEELEGRNEDTGSEFNVKRLGMNRHQSEQSFSYYRLRNLSNTKSLEVLMRTTDGLKQVELPERMLDNIARFLREDSKPRNEKFDCGSFVHFVNNIPYKIGSFEPDDWKWADFLAEDQLKTGDTVVIADAKEENKHEILRITHMAIYIGDSLYISKFGNKGRLIVTSLEEMQKAHGGNNVYRVVPNPEKARIGRS